MQLEQNLGPGTVTTVYTYDAANQLEAAQQGSTTWQYTYDENGSLISDGVKTYTYDSANRLIEVSNQSTVTSLSYNGLGQRLSMDAAGVIATYVMDGDRPLTAETGGNTNFYLYGPSAGSGWGAIGEKTAAWNFSLPDGTNTPRQLTDVQGEITLSARYTPWGDTLETHGTGNFTFGYFGGVMDAATGLLYVGNGQYYDPATGRFLTRDVYPNSTNPYVPWNPIGVIVGPLGLIALVFGRKRKRGKWDTLIIIVLLGISAGVSIAACAPAPAPNPTNPAPQVPPTQTPSPIPSETPNPTQTPSPTAPPAPTNTPLIDGDCGIPPARYDYPCTNKDGKVCIDPEKDKVVDQIAHTILGEGGTWGAKVAANVLQTIVNRAYVYWVFTNHAGINPNKIPWSQINREKLENLFLFILSEPGGDGWPSYNAWRAPEPRYSNYWQPIYDAVESVLDKPGAPPSTVVQVNNERPAAEISSDFNVQWYGATIDPDWRPSNSYVHSDTFWSYRDGKRLFCGRQFYGNDGVIKPPKAVIDCPEG